VGLRIVTSVGVSPGNSCYLRRKQIKDLLIRIPDKNCVLQFYRETELHDRQDLRILLI
jgi:hypothetical protein